ncbi:MAG: hypothetical protein M1828_002682 [Chrysothrix sp. TS-e1954]|nr:MAG: hypothetical protein M1828_002682 [Chrysothrix sp. TS-e1954]
MATFANLNASLPSNPTALSQFHDSKLSRESLIHQYEYILLVLDQMAPSSGPAQKSQKALKGAPTRSTRRQSAPRAICTHISMVKVYGWDLRCQLCNRYSILGFMYECEQDAAVVRHHKKFNVRKRLLKNKHRRASSEMEMMGFHPTVVEGAKAGHYTKEQIELLKAQKMKARRAVEEAMEKEESLKSRKPAPPGTFDEFPKASSKKEEPKVSKTPPKQAPSKAQPAVCAFRVCHNCRPFSRDRTFLTVETVMNEEYSMPSEWEPTTMPVHDRDLVRQLGLWSTYIPSFARPVTSLMSLATSPTTSSMENNYEESDSGDLASMKKSTSSISLWQRLKSRRSSENLKELAEDHAEGSKGFRESIKSALVALLRHASSVSPSSSSVQELAKKLEELDAGTDVDVELWRQLTDELLKHAAAVPLPDETEDDATRLLQQPNSDDVEGVALTEEAIENHAPDLIVSV